MQDKDQLPSQPQAYPPAAPQEMGWTDVQMNSLRFYRDYDYNQNYGPEPQQAEAPKRQFGMRDVLYAIFRHPILILSCIIFISFAAYVFVVIQPNVYKSEARVFVNFSRLAQMTDPTGSNGSLLNSRMPPIDLRTEFGILNSQALAERVVADLGPGAILPDLGPRQQSSLKTTLKKYLNFAERHYTHEQLAVARVMENFSTRLHQSGSAVMVLEFADTKPERAQLVLDSITRNYEKEHIRLNSQRWDADYLRQKTQETKDALEKLEQEIATLLKQHNVSDLTNQKEILLGQIAANESEQTNVRSNIKSLELQTAALKKLLDDMEDQARNQAAGSLPIVSGNDGLQQVRDQLTQLQLEESSLQEIYTDQHPQLISVRAKIARLKSMLPAPAANDKGEVDPLLALKSTEGYRTLKVQFDTAMATLTGDRDKIAELVAYNKQLKENLEGISSVENAIAIRNREQALLSEEYKAYSRSLSQVEISQVLDEKDVSNIKIMQAATMPIEPLKSSRKMFIVLLGGIFGSVFVGLGLAIALEFFSNTMKTNEEVEHTLGAPVLITVPRQRYHLLPEREAGSEQA